MRKNPWISQILALCTLILLFVISIPFFAERIQAELETEVEEVLQDEKMDWVTAQLTGRDLILTGSANTALQKHQVFAKMRNISGIDTIDNQIILKLPLISPYTFKALYKDKQLLLSGYVPDEKSRDALLKQVQTLFKQTKIESELMLGRGHPQQWQNMLLKVLPQLSKFKQGGLEIIDYQVRFTGTVGTKTAKTFPQLVKTLQAKNYLLQLYINTSDMQLKRISPYTFNISYQKNKLILTGYIPNKRLQQKLLKQLKQIFKQADIVNQLQLAYGQPKQWYKALPDIIQSLKSLKYGELDVIDYDIRLTGTVKTTKMATALKQQMSRLQKHNYHAYIYITAEDEQVLICQKKFNRALDKNKINFTSGKSQIKTSSFNLLERLSDVANACPEFSLQIAGHTDSEGNAIKNKQLSQARATAVLNHLVKLGIKKSRLQVVGYGESRPISDNHTLAGRAKNRRIEFIVKVPTK